MILSILDGFVGGSRTKGAGGRTSEEISQAVDFGVIRKLSKDRGSL